MQWWLYDWENLKTSQVLEQILWKKKHSSNRQNQTNIETWRGLKKRLDLPDYLLYFIYCMGRYDSWNFIFYFQVLSTYTHAMRTKATWLNIVKSNTKGAQFYTNRWTQFLWKHFLDLFYFFNLLQSSSMSKHEANCNSDVFRRYELWIFTSLPRLRNFDHSILDKSGPYHMSFVSLWQFPCGIATPSQIKKRI